MAAAWTMMSREPKEGQFLNAASRITPAAIEAGRPAGAERKSRHPARQWAASLRSFIAIVAMAGFPDIPAAKISSTRRGDGSSGPESIPAAQPDHSCSDRSPKPGSVSDQSRAGKRGHTPSPGTKQRM
jgi:hypothetical protein